MPISVNQNTTFLQNGFSSDIKKVPNNMLGTETQGLGISYPTLVQYDVIPAAYDAAFVCPAGQTPVSGTPLTLTAANTVQFLGQSVIQMDCLRVPTITFSAVTAFTAQVTFTTEGYDNRNVRMTASRTFPNGFTPVVGTSYALGLTSNAYPFSAGKAFWKIISVTPSGAGMPGGTTVAVGNGTNIGLPHFVPNPQYIKNASFGTPSQNNGAAGYLALTAINPFGGTNFVPGYQFNPVIDGAPANALGPQTPDARGIIIPPIITTNQINGVNQLSVLYYVYGADSYLQGLLSNNVLSAQTQTQITAAADNAGQMLARDEVGLQYSTSFPQGIPFTGV